MTPRLAAALLRAVVAPDVAEPFVGDLLELHARHVVRRGPARAALLLWREVAIALVRLPWRGRRGDPLTSPGDPAMTAFSAELRLAARRLWQAPTFTLLSALTLALGVGAVAALFGVLNPVVLHPLAYPAPRQLVLVQQPNRDGGAGNMGFLTYADLTRASHTLAAAAAVGWWDATLSGRDDAERVTGARVSWSYFRTLGVRPALGGDFSADMDVPGRQRVVMLSHGLWRRRYGGDPQVVGRTINVDDVPHVVAGVMPATFDNALTPDVQIWRVLGYGPEFGGACRTCRHLRMVARLRPGVTVAAAEAELTRLSAGLVRDYPSEYATSGMRVSSLAERVTESVRPTVAAMAGAVCLVLLLAAANLANLQLGRAVRRERELAIRTALGASRRHAVRQLLAESMWLAGVGSGVGVAAAGAALSVVRGMLPASLPHVAQIRLDAPTLGVALLVAALLSAVVVLAPLARGDGRRQLETLRAGTRTLSSGRQLTRALLVGAEVALALTLLVGAGLLTRTLVRLTRVNAGFDAENLLTVETQASGAKYREDAAVIAHHDAVREAVRAIPGVLGVGVTSQLPLGGNVDQYGIRAYDRPLPNPELASSADRYAVSPDFLRAMRIAVTRGRSLAEQDDRTDAPPVVVVSEALARRIWEGEDPIGKRIQMGDTARPWRTVVGVAANVRHSGLDATETQQVYVPQRQWYFSDNQVTLVVRTAGDPRLVAAAVRAAVRAVDPSQPLGRVATMREVVAVTTAQRRLARTLFVAFALVALALAAAGIYGVLAAQIAERTREIGLRRALGATPRAIVGGIVSHAARLAGPGLVVGVAGSLVVGRTLRGLLFGVEAADPWTLGAVTVLLGAVALVATLVPALRALGIGPMEALRSGDPT